MKKLFFSALFLLGIVFFSLQHPLKADSACSPAPIETSCTPSVSGIDSKKAYLKVEYPTLLKNQRYTLLLRYQAPDGTVKVIANEPKVKSEGPGAINDIELNPSKYDPNGKFEVQVLGNVGGDGCWKTYCEVSFKLPSKIESGIITPVEKAAPLPKGQLFTVPLDIRGKCNVESINTALGCIPVNDTNAFAAWFLKWAIGIAGGVAFLLMLFAGFKIMTASGNPERLQSGRELLTAAISGLILIIFSVFLLKLIGVEIFKLPGLG